MTKEQLRHELLYGNGDNEELKKTLHQAYLDKDTDPAAKKFYDTCNQILEELKDPLTKTKEDDIER